MNLGVIGECILDDLFALGSLFYDTLTGKKPYWDLEDNERIRKFKLHEYPSLKDIHPESFAKVIEKCWNKKYETILDLQRDLGDESSYQNLDSSVTINPKRSTLAYIQNILKK